MKRPLSCLVFLLSISVATAEPLVVIVRHAERATTGGKDPELTATGTTRAETLARMLKDFGIASVFTSEFKRTQQTAAITATAFKITPEVIPAKDTAALVTKLRALQGNALVVGHSDTVPILIKALGIETPVTIADDDYSNLFVVALGDKPHLLRLHYP